MRLGASHKPTTFPLSPEQVSRIQNSWSADTSAHPEAWSKINRAHGQCAVTACLVQDLVGGDIIWAEVPLPDGSTASHYFNQVGDVVVDLTRQQFPIGTVVPAGVSKNKQFATTRDYILSFESTRTRYLTLRSRYKGNHLAGAVEASATQADDGRPVPLALRLVVWLACIWIALCLFSLGWLTYAVPVTSQDIAQASWLSPWRSPFLTYFIWAISAGIGLVSCASMLATNSVKIALVGLAVIAALNGQNSDEQMLRAGVLAGGVKIGCFVPETAECRQMLGVPTGTAASRYKDGADSSWYVQRLAKLGISPEMRDATAIATNTAFIRAPFYLGQARLINERLTQQRAETAAFIKKNTPAATAR